MKKCDSYPAIFGSKYRPAQQIKDLNELRNSNSKSYSYSVHKGDYIVFPDRIEDFVVFKQPLLKNNEQFDIILLVTINGQSGYVSLGGLYRNGTSFFTKEVFSCCFSYYLSLLNNDYERIEFLVGLKLSVPSTEEILSEIKLSNGEKQYQDRPFPVFQYDGITVEYLLRQIASLFKAKREVFRDLSLFSVKYDVEADEDGLWDYEIKVPIGSFSYQEINGIPSILLQCNNNETFGTISAFQVRDYLNSNNIDTKSVQMLFYSQTTKRVSVIQDIDIRLNDGFVFLSALSFKPIEIEKDGKDATPHSEDPATDMPDTNYTQNELDGMYKQAYEGEQEAEWNTD